MTSWAQFSQRATWPPSAAVRQFSIADITFNWPRLTWPALASRQAGPWSRKMSATSRARRATRSGRQAGASGSAAFLEGILARFRPSRSSGLVTSSDRVDGDVRVKRRRFELGVSEQNLNDPDIDVLFEQMRGEAVPKRVGRDALGDSRRSRRGGNGATELPSRHRVDRVEPREQPTPWGRDLPPVAQQLQQLRGEHDKAILLPLALLDAQQHALAVDIRDLQPDHLGYAQTGPIGHAERHLVFDAWGGGQKSRNFLGAQHDRRPARLANQNQTPDKIVPFERYLEKEAKRENGGVDARRTHTALRHM